MPALAKTSRPKLFGVIARERLFRLLDQGRAQRAIWICAPPGSGKTTLVASYLEARSLQSLWYQTDAGDADAATFFYYLGQSAQAWSHRRKPLPLLTPEYLPDLAGFARRYFRELFDRLPHPATLVLDNWQDAAESASWRAITAQAAAEIPEHVSLILISRTEPPAEFARLRASRQLPVLGWEELRLTLDETRQLASLREKRSKVEAGTLHESSDGWVAGIVLMLEHLARAELPVPASALEATAFGYFASIVFEQASPDVQRLLLTTCLFPRFTASMAERVSGVGEAGRLLLDLCERHYFTDRREHSEAAFQYHALFREFLLDRVRQRYSGAERKQLEHRAGRLLEAHGQREDAVGLYCRSGDFESAIRLILEEAPKLLAQGRAQALASWIAELPEQSMQAQPWLRYWLGMARACADPVAGRALLEHAYARFGELDDARGQLFATCAVVEVHFVLWSDFTRFDEWIEPLDRLISQVSLESPETELRALCAFLTLALYRRPQHPSLPSCIRRITELLHQPVDAGQKVKAGTILFTYYFWIGDPEPGPHLSKLMLPLVSQAPSVDQFHAWSWHASGLMLRAENAEAVRAMEQARNIAEANGLHFLRSLRCLLGALPVLYDGDPDAAETFLAEAAASSLDSSRDLDASLYHFERAWQAALRGDCQGACDQGEKALKHALATGVWGPATSCYISLAQSLVESQDHEKALTCLEAARSRIADVRAPLFEFDILLIRASSALLRSNDAACREALGRALALGRAHEFIVSSRWLPKVMARLLAFALEHGIEPEYARTIIRKRKLVPESPDAENWPWPVMVRTLGRFTVLVDGHASVAATAQGRPFDLLKALIATGGRQVHSDALIEQLWPDSDDGRKTLEINLHRLRKLLGSDRACMLHDGRLTLDPGSCWVDVWAFERACNRIADHADPATEPAAAADRLLRLYQGQFLAYDAEQPWMLATRARLRSRFLRCVQRLGQQLESAGRWDEATALYQRGLEADGLAEDLYRRLMLCHGACGRRAEALEVYRRCRHTLSVVLGIDPSMATQAVYRSLLEGS